MGTGVTTLCVVCNRRHSFDRFKRPDNPGCPQEIIVSTRIAIRLFVFVLAVSLSAPFAAGYIHFPPMTMQKMCKDSHRIRLLKVAKHDKDKGVIVFEVAESFKGQKSQTTSLRHVVRGDPAKTRPIFDWLENGKTAVMFAIEGTGGENTVGIGYVFIDNFCYSVEFKRAENYWIMIRPEPEMSACYFGNVERLQEVVRDILDGKEVEVPVKAPDQKPDPEKRRQEINDALSAIRGG
jgi:hypothetical protein